MTAAPPERGTHFRHREELGCGSDRKSCGSDRQIADIKKPRRPRSTGLSNVEAEAGIEPAWADLQAGAKVLYNRDL